MNYQKAISQIVKASDQHKGDSQNFKYSFLIGAGASVSSHLPDGTTLCEEVLNTYDDIKREDIPKTQARLGVNRYQAIFNELRQVLHDSNISEFVRDMILDNARRPAPDFRWIINNCYSTLANILLEKPGFSRAVFTTNFDPLMYYSFIQDWNTEPVLIRHPEELVTMLPKQAFKNFPSLIYLHGYWQNHDQYHEPGQLQSYISEWGAMLNDWLDQGLIVIGYSGSEESIALEWIKKVLNNSKSVWWGVYTPAGNIDHSYCSEIESKIGSHNGNLNFFPIPDADQFALDLGSALDLDKPKQIIALNSVFDWFRPNSPDAFCQWSRLGNGVCR